MGLGGDADLPDEKPGAVAAAAAAIACSICLDAVTSEGGRSTARLHCGHEFHLDCIGSAFNAKGVMQCPNCRKVEKGNWLYANGSPSLPDLNIHEWSPDEDLYELNYSEMPFGVHWCPFGRLAQVTSSFEDGESSPALSFQDILGRHAIYTDHPPTSSTALTCLTCSRFIFQLPQLLMFFLKVLLRVLHITITGVRSLAHWMSTVLMLYLQLIDIIISGNIILQHSFLMAPVLIVGIRLQFLLQRGLRDLIQMVFQGQGHLSTPLWSGTVPGLLARFLPHWFHRISPTLELRRMFMSTPKATMEPPLQVYGDLEVRGASLPLDQHQSLHQITLASITSSLPHKLLVKAYKM